MHKGTRYKIDDSPMFSYLYAMPFGGFSGRTRVNSILYHAHQFSLVQYWIVLVDKVYSYSQYSSLLGIYS